MAYNIQIRVGGGGIRHADGKVLNDYSKEDSRSFLKIKPE